MSNDFELFDNKDELINQKLKESYGTDIVQLTKEELRLVIEGKKNLFIPVNDGEYGIILKIRDYNADCHAVVKELSDEDKKLFADVDIKKLSEWLNQVPQKTVHFAVIFEDGTGDIVEDNPVLQLKDCVPGSRVSVGNRVGTVVRFMAAEGDDIRQLAYEAYGK